MQNTASTISRVHLHVRSTTNSSSLLPNKVKVDPVQKLKLNLWPYSQDFLPWFLCSSNKKHTSLTHYYSQKKYIKSWKYSAHLLLQDFTLVNYIMLMYMKIRVDKFNTAAQMKHDCSFICPLYSEVNSETVNKQQINYKTLSLLI